MVSIDDYSAQLLIGSTNQSSLRILILLEELCLNAFKALAFVSKEKRKIAIKITYADNLSITCINTFNEQIDISCGYGTSILSDVTTSLGGILSKTMHHNEAEVIFKCNLAE